MIPQTILKGFPWPSYILKLSEKEVLWRAEPFGFKFKSPEYLTYYGLALFVKGTRIVWGHRNVYYSHNLLEIYDRKWLTHRDKRDDVFFNPERLAEFKLY